jgi:hypothetical protein
MKHPTLTYLAWSLLNALFAFGAVLAASLLFGWRAMLRTNCVPDCSGWQPADICIYGWQLQRRNRWIKNFYSAHFAGA